VQAFFPGEEGGTAVAGVLSGRVNPSGHLPVSMPRSAGAQPFTYLHPPLGGNGDVTNLRSTPALPFGHGLSYTTFVHSDLEVDAQVPTDGHIGASVRVTNTGDRPGADVVQLYAHDVVGSVTRPVAQLVGYRRVHLEAGASAVVTFAVPTARLAFSDRDLVRVVEPGEVEIWVGPSCAERETEGRVTLTGSLHPVGVDSPRWTTVSVSG
jgi:beta-glucosidase